MTGCRVGHEAPTGGPASGLLSRNRSFLLLWIGQFVSQLGDRLAIVAFPWVVYTSTNSPVDTGAVLALYTAPYVLFGASAGVLIDRLNKRTIMVIADLARAGLVLLVPAVAAHSLIPVYVLSFAISTAAVFFEPSRLAILPDLVRQDQLMRVNSLMAAGENATEVLGYVLAGLTVAALSTETAFRLDAVTFVASAAALWAMRYAVPNVASGHRSAPSFWTQLREGIGFLVRERALLLNTLVTVCFAAGLGASYPLTFLLAVDVLNAGARGFGLMEAAIGLGYLLGSVALAALASRVRRGWAMIGGWAVMGVSLAVVGSTSNIWQACAAFLVFGTANSAALIAIDTYLLATVPERLRGRVFGVRFTVTQGIYALSVIIGAAMAGFAGTRTLLLLSGGLMLLTGLSAALLRDISDA